MARNQKDLNLRSGKIVITKDASGNGIELRRAGERLYLRNYEGSDQLMFMWISEENDADFEMSISREDFETVVEQFDKFFSDIEFEKMRKAG